ncbi:phosphate--AMP phosphotransferase [Candidatus Methanoprimaticola sp. MG2]|uniref:phosphate--AMP phosphotransferase n=1 Tax=Candidatus Methanoprimaticola sp. MG2 TaxID=3228838 RepID=UPI0039C68ADA
MASAVSDELVQQLTFLQRRIVDEGKQILVVFEGRSGRVMGRVINEFMNLLDPRGMSYFHFIPEDIDSPREILSYIARGPAKGVITVYDRSWFSWLVNVADGKGDVSGNIETVQSLERYLTNNGIILVKFFLNMSDEATDNLGKAFGAKARKSSTFLTDDHIDRKKWNEKLLMPLIAKTGSVSSPWDIIDVKDIYMTMTSVVQTFISRVTHVMEFGNYVDGARVESLYPNPRKSEDLTLTAKSYKGELEALCIELALLQERLAASDRSLILVFEGWDAAGKGGSIKRLVRALNPRGYRVRTTAAPSGIEKDHSYLWRFTYSMPKKGNITVFDRSWYGRMMVEPIEGFCTDEEYQRSAEEIRSFERHISYAGGILIKFWMEISYDEQLARFKARQDNPYKQWKITDEDWRNREKWDIYSDHVDAMIESTNTPYAPWVVVESEDKKYGRLKVLRTVVDTLKRELE